MRGLLTTGVVRTTVPLSNREGRGGGGRHERTHDGGDEEVAKDAAVQLPQNASLQRDDRGRRCRVVHQRELSEYVARREHLRSAYLFRLGCRAERATANDEERVRALTLAHNDIALLCVLSVGEGQCELSKLESSACA